MGDCYCVDMAIKSRNDKEIVKVLNNFIKNPDKKRYPNGINWCLDKLPNLTLDSVDNLVKVFFAHHQHKIDIEKRDDKVLYSAGFDASYGWCSIMEDMFEMMCPYLEDDSKLVIDHDEGVEKMVCKKGKMVWL